MPTSPGNTDILDTRRAILIELLTLALSFDEIADVMGVSRHIITSDIAALKKLNWMPKDRPTLDYYGRLVLYRDVLGKQINRAHSYRFNADAERCTRIVAVLRESLNIKDVVKATNLILKGIAMQRMFKLPKALWRTATIWRIALGSSETNNGVAHDTYRQNLWPPPFVATFRVDTFEMWFERWLNSNGVTPMNSPDELAERFVAFIEFRADPGYGLAMAPNPTLEWNEDFLRADIVITATTRELIENIISTNCTPDVVNMLNMLAPQSGEPGVTLEEIAREFRLSRERIRQILNSTFNMIRAQLYKELHLGAAGQRIDITDTALLQQRQRIRELDEQLHTANTRLAEHTQALVAAGILNREDTETDSVGAFGLEAFKALGRRVDEFDLSVRSANCLLNGGYEFIWQLAKKTRGEILKMKNFGTKSLHEIEKILTDLGLSFGMKIPAGIQAQLPGQ